MLSILIPVYNYAIYSLVKTLHDQANKENIDFEIIVLDDCSTDTNIITENEKACLLKNVRLLNNDSNLGRTLTRKKLAEAAWYTTLLFLDADVKPVHDTFIKNYIAIPHKPVVLGGIVYTPESLQKGKELRYKYGRLREQKTAAERSIYPYRNVLSANMLIDKTVFLDNNYSESNSLYGLDIYFSYNLIKHKIPVLHIDNPVYHLGLENNDVFFNKALLAVKTRWQLLGGNNYDDANGMLKVYRKLKKYGLTGIVSFFFKITSPVLKKLILRKDPSLFCLDVYRLGYLCSLK